ncbi:Alpha-aminoadipate--LysW ligase LysX [Planctomycetales bacterium 10988]|nr:Alpha-aminoadipate--LysW ligase LysX [Planctomycetales bacterium 10988]
MSLIVLGSPRSWYVQDLERAGKSFSCPVIPAPFTRLAGSLGTKSLSKGVSGDLDLTKAKVILVRSMPPGSLEQIVFRLNLLAQLEALNIPVLNPPKVLEVAVDKYLALARLEQAGIQVPPTMVCQSVEEAMLAYHQLGPDVVVKPVFGAEGRGLVRVQDEDMAWRVFKSLTQIQSVIYLQTFLPHPGYDYRVFLLGSHCFTIRRKSSTDWRTNCSRGAVAEAVNQPRIEAIAKNVAQQISSDFLGVDIITTPDKTEYVLEVNAVPGWRALAEAHRIDIGKLVIEYLLSRSTTK